MQDELKACDGQLQAAIQVEIERTIKGLYTMRQAERDMIAMHSARRVMEIVTRADPALAAAQAEVARLRSAVEQICIDSNGDWKERRHEPQKALDDIHRIAVDAYYASENAALVQP